MTSQSDLDLARGRITELESQLAHPSTTPSSLNATDKQKELEQMQEKIQEYKTKMAAMEAEVEQWRNNYGDVTRESRAWRESYEQLSEECERLREGNGITLYLVRNLSFFC